MTVLRWTVPLMLAVLVLSLGGSAAPAEAMPFPPSRIGTSADYQGFINGRFLILNMHGGFLHPSLDPVQENIRYAAWMNAGAIRIFATDSTQRSVNDGTWVGNRIADVAPTLRANDVKLIVALVNNHQEVPGRAEEQCGHERRLLAAFAAVLPGQLEGAVPGLQPQPDLDGGQPGRPGRDPGLGVRQRAEHPG